MITLYNFAQSTCSQKVRICLHEKKLHWKDELLLSGEQRHLEDWYLKLNPNGVVPTIIDGNEKPIFESFAIMEYLEDTYHLKPLRPSTNNERAQMRAWTVFVDHLTTPAVRYPSFQFGGLLEKFQNMAQEKFDMQINKRPLKSEFYRQMNKDSGFPESVIRKSLLDIKKSVKRLNNMIESSGGPWLMGRQFTLADIAIGPLLDRIEDLGLNFIWTTDFPKAQNWLSQFQSRPSVIKTFYPGSRLSEMFPFMKIGKGSGKHLEEQFDLND